MKVNDAFSSPATGVVVDPSRIRLRALGRTFQTAALPAGVVHALGEEVPRRPTGLKSRPIAQLAERDAPDVIRLVLGIPTVPLPRVIAPCRNPRPPSEAPVRGPTPALTASDRDVTAFHVVGEGALVALDQEAEADTTVAERAVLHETRGIAKLVPSGATDLPSRVRLRRRLAAFQATRHGALAAEGQTDTVLVGPLRRRLVGADVSALATAAVTDLRRPSPAVERAVIGAPA